MLLQNNNNKPYHHHEGAGEPLKNSCKQTQACIYKKVHDSISPYEMCISFRKLIPTAKANCSVVFLGTDKLID